MSEVKNKRTLSPFPHVFAFTDGDGASFGQQFPYYGTAAIHHTLPKEYFFDFPEDNAKEMAKRFSAYEFKFPHGMGYYYKLGGRIPSPFSHVHKVYLVYDRMGAPKITQDNLRNLFVWGDILGDDLYPAILDNNDKVIRIFVQRTVSPDGFQDFVKHKKDTTFYLRVANNMVIEKDILEAKYISERTIRLGLFTQNQKLQQMLDEMMDTLAEFEKETAELKLEGFKSIKDQMARFRAMSGVGAISEKTVMSDINRMYDDIIAAERYLKRVTDLRRSGALTIDLKNAIVDGAVEICGLPFVLDRISKSGYKPAYGFPEMKGFMDSINRLMDAKTQEAKQAIMNEVMVVAQQKEGQMVDTKFSDERAHPQITAQPEQPPATGAGE